MPKDGAASSPLPEDRLRLLHTCSVHIGRDSKRCGACILRLVRRPNETANHDSRCYAHRSEEPLARVQMDLPRRANEKGKGEFSGSSVR